MAGSGASAVTAADGTARLTLRAGRHRLVASEARAGALLRRAGHGALMRRLACALLAAVALRRLRVRRGRVRWRATGPQVRVTRDFGRELLDENAVEEVRDGQTVMRLLRSDADVKTRYGGRFVQSIDGLAGSGEGGYADWFYFVNGIEADVGAADYELSPGDVVQWDYRNWRVTPDVRATVGAFPEPFVHGLEGKRRPVRVECADAGSRACGDVKDLLRDAGVPATGCGAGRGGRAERDPRGGRAVGARPRPALRARAGTVAQAQRRVRSLR